MVDEIYSPHIRMERMSDPNRLIDGSEALHSVEDDLAARIPDHRHELIRVIADGPVACLETMIVAPVSTEYAPACVWWWFDADGMVAAEVGWFDWSIRSHDSRAAHGTVPSPAPPQQRPPGWAREVADRYAAMWTGPPGPDTFERYSDECTFGCVGAEPERRGRSELARDHAESHSMIPLPGRHIDIHQVAAEASTVALLVVIGDGARATRGTIILTMDDSDLIVSERRYLDWKLAVDQETLTGRLAVGSPGWTLDAVTGSTDG